MYKVKDKDELRKIIEEKIIPLDTIDTSEITDMSGLFRDIKEINGFISNWDVSNVENMCCMFAGSIFNQDISSWNTSKVKFMDWMFERSKFNQNLGTWDLSRFENIEAIFTLSTYSMEQYTIDREKVHNEYLLNLKEDLEKSSSQFEF